MSGEEPTRLSGRVLIVAGSDSGGGAGIQADIKAVTALGGFAMTAITALTAQNTLGVSGIHGVPPAFIQQQIAAVVEDLGVDAVKTGMLHSRAVIEAVAERLNPFAAAIPVVVDPVMVAQSGSSLLEEDAVAAVIEHMLPLASLITPNTPEAERLTGLGVGDLAGQKRAAEVLVGMGASAALVKGGHLEGAVIADVLATEDGVEVFEGPRIDTQETHGTGCTLASAIAAGLAQGLPMREAVGRARRYLAVALATAPGYGQGQGPVNHAHTVRRFS